VDVRLDQPGHHGSAAEVDHPRAARVDVAPEVDELAVVDENRLDDAVARVHRVDPAVDEREALAVMTPAVGGRGTGAHAGDGGGRTHDGAGFEQAAAAHATVGLVLTHLYS
jgi:hypothetical protein